MDEKENKYKDPEEEMDKEKRKKDKAEAEDDAGEKFFRDDLEEETQELEHPDYTAELIHMLRSGIDPEDKAEQLANYHSGDIADAIPQLTREERLELYRLMVGMDEDVLSEVFAYLDDASEYLAEMDIERAADIVENMDADDAVDVLEELDETQREDIIRHMDEESRHDIRLITSYDDDQIGSKMTTNFIVVHKGMSIKQAMKALVKQAPENDNMSTLYVLDENECFCGAITLQDLIIARNGTDLEDITSTSYPYVYATESVTDCIEELKDYSEDSIPVLDADKKILGVITSMDLVEVVDDEMGEDYAKFAGLTDEEDLNETLGQSLRKRIPWLMILMALGLVVSSVIGVFEKVISQLAIVVTFQSLILDMAGNVGTQSLAVTIRVLTDEELTGVQKLKLVLKEGRVGLVTGLLLGTISLVFVGLYIHFFKAYDWPHAFAVSGCIGLAMVVAMLISSLVGTAIPLFFHKIGVDPAVASGPLITTMNDLVAVVTYYGLAWILLLNILHLGG